MGRRIPLNRSDFLMNAIMASGMSLFMTLSATFMRLGFDQNFINERMSSFIFALVISFPLALILSRIARNVIARVTNVEKIPQKKCSHTTVV
jgi:hypothetical protein